MEASRTVSSAPPQIASLGHIGLRVFELERMRAFYRDVLGFVQTDEDPDAGFVFLSARPAAEHHQVLLCRGRTVEHSNAILQQLSFRCDTLDDVIAYFHRFRDANVEIDMIVSHGNAVGIYFFDPERNRCEVYWDTGLKAKQPFVEPIDLSLPRDEIARIIAARVDEYGSTGYQDPTWRARTLKNATPQRDR